MIKYLFPYFLLFLNITPVSAKSPAIEKPNLTALYLKLTTKPYDKELLNKFTSIVNNKKYELLKTPSGRELIKEANRFRKVNYLKTKLDKCFGANVLDYKSARDLLNSAISDTSILSDCVYSGINNLDLDLSNFIEKYDQHTNKIKKEMSLPRSKDLSKKIFEDTIVKAAQAEARLQYLIKDNSQTGDKWNLKVADSICTREINCPEALSTKIKNAALQQINTLKTKNIKRESAKEASQRLTAKVTEMFSSFYSKENPYYFKNTSITNAPKALVQNIKKRNNNPIELISNIQTARHLITYRYDQTDQDIFRNSFRTKNGKLIQRANLNSIKSDLLGSVPESFYNIQNSIQEDQLVKQLASNQHFADSLGYGIKPQLSNIPRIGQSLLLLNENSSIDKTFDKRIAQLEEKSLLEEKDQQLERLRNNLKDLAEDVYSNDKDSELERADEVLKKLLVSNPGAAAREVMKSPENIDIYCSSLKEIEDEKEMDRYKSYALMAASIAVIPIAIVSAPLVGGVALAAVGAMDIAYSADQYISLKEMSRLKEVACYGSQATSSTCAEYEENMDEAITILATTGIGLGLSGGVKLLKFLPKISNIKTSIRSNPKLLSLLKKKKAHILEGEEIPENFWESLMDDLDSMRPDYESVIKNIDEAHLTTASSGPLRNISDADIERMFRGRALSEKSIAKLKVQVRSRERSNHGAINFAKENGWDPDKSESFIIRSNDLEPGFMQPDRAVHPVSLKDNQTFGYKKGWVQVQVHGNGNSFANNGQQYTAKELASNIKAQGHKNQPIELASCWGGKPSANELTMAQQLADELGVPVVAPSRTLEISNTPYITKSGKDLSPEGRWRVFYPNT